MQGSLSFADVKIEQQVMLAFDASDVHLFDTETGDSLKKTLPEVDGALA
jgi:hypothetical protein